MKIDILPKNPHDLYTTPLLQQTAYWSEVKSKLGFIPLAFEIEVREKDLHPSLSSSARIRDDILILYRKITKEERDGQKDELDKRLTLVEHDVAFMKEQNQIFSSKLDRILEELTAIKVELAKKAEK